MLNAIPERDLLWLAGLMEGEGSFYPGSPNHAPNLPWVSVKTTDKDVIDRVGALWGRAVCVDRNKSTKEHHKTPYSARLRGRDAVQMMWLLRPHMGQRRRARIDEVLATAVFYKTGPGPKRVCSTANDLRAAAEALVIPIC